MMIRASQKLTWLLFVVLNILCSVRAYGQRIVVLPENTQLKNYLSDTPWKFQPGDRPDWAAPSFNDEAWKDVITNFGTANLPQGWSGSGWFRLRIRKPHSRATDNWGLYINQDGASEIYLDGKKIMSIGQFGNAAHSSVAARNPFLTIPLALTDTLPHLLAIRYCNYHRYFPDFVGFQVWIGDLHQMNQEQKSDQRFYDYLLMSGSALAILALLHILLFVFYRKQKVNFYYSLFVSFTALALFSRYGTIVTTSPASQVFLYKLFIIGVHSAPMLSWLLLYSVANRPVKRLLFYVILAVTLVFVSIPLINWNNNWLAIFSPIGHITTNVFSLLVYAEGTLRVFQAIRAGNKRLWLIASGMIVLCLYGVFIGSNMFDYFTLKEVLGSMALICLLMPVLFSIYIAIDVASTNRRLAIQLLENDRLSQENIAREQEKNKLVSGQAEQLERKVLERTEQVREQAEKLRVMDEAKSRFFINLTHEFKTPLTLIINPAKELLQERDPQMVKQYADFILQNSERLLALINQLLDLSRLENRQMEINYVSLDLVKWLGEHVGQFASLAERKGIRLKFYSGVRSAWMRADPDKMEKIVQNLLSNAIKFIDDDGTIDVGFKINNEQEFEITVADSGIGIADEKLNHIFDRFYQADSSDTRSREGAGIGLALVKEMTTLLGGSIAVTSEENAGTTFIVTLPLIRADESSVSADFHHQSEDRFTLADKEEIIYPQEAQPKEMILVAEDNEQLRQFIEMTLRDSYTVVPAKDGQEGIDAAINQIPGLIITDLMMPRKNGYELCDRLKNDERTSHIPVIMLTAKTDQDSRIQGILTGADAYLTKPFDKTELLALITNLLATRNRLREKYCRPESWVVRGNHVPTLDQKFLTRVRDCIYERIDDTQFGAEQLGSEVGLSRTQLHRKLKDTTGKSPGELIRSIRMERAHELLQQRVATVAEAGYLVGYGNPNNFSTSFSKYFGYPPRQVGEEGLKN